MFSKFTRNSANLKGLLFIAGIIIITGVLWYTQQLVDSLKERSTEYLRFRIRIFEENINNPQSDTNVGFFFNEVIKTADYPIIYTDVNRNPQSWNNISEHLDTLIVLSKKDSLFLIKTLQNIAEENEPIPIKYQDSVLGYYYYGLSEDITRLKNLPYVAIGIAVIFILTGYFGFNYIRRSEQRNIWVGMAKETAHQLGTPLSSLAGWIELIKLNSENKETAINEIQNDLLRLNKIATRFSKIGSVPDLEEKKLESVVENVVGYFRKRLPQLNKQIQINTRIEKNISVKINSDLFEWVLENLLKNAIDAIEKNNGLIEIFAEKEKENGLIYIDISDNGKGIPKNQRKSIFKPGFSTKKRGWGLGLSLAKRIIDEYHKGKLLLKDSRYDSGTTFRIVLKSTLN